MKFNDVLCVLWEGVLEIFKIAFQIFSYFNYQNISHKNEQKNSLKNTSRQYYIYNTVFSGCRIWNNATLKLHRLALVL